jgi:hypothetical protein
VFFAIDKEAKNNRMKKCQICGNKNAEEMRFCL